MNIHDYLIVSAGHDWSRLLRPWRRVLPETFDPWLVNRFGDVILATPDGGVHLLDVAGGEVRFLAASREEFLRLVDYEANANDWFLIPFVDDCVAAGLVLEDGNCYGYVVPPVLGGEYKLSNFHVLPLSEHYALHADIHEQVRDLPDGTEVDLRVRPDA